MKRKIFGIFVITLLTISYIPIIGSEESHVPESYENKDGDIKIFFMGRTYSHRVYTEESFSHFLAYLGIFKDAFFLFVDICENYIFLVDGKIQNLEPSCCLVLLNFTGIGTREKLWQVLHLGSSPFGDYFLILMGSCKSYDTSNARFSIGG